MNSINLRLVPVLLVSVLFCHAGFTERPRVPETWNDAELLTLELPLADSSVSRAYAPADYYYYRIPVRPIYKSYPVYHPDREPEGYFEELNKIQPQLLWEDQGIQPKLETEADWIAAGELVFDATIFFLLGTVEWAHRMRTVPSCETPNGTRKPLPL